jgi:hypothetical protein
MATITEIGFKEAKPQTPLENASLDAVERRLAELTSPITVDADVMTLQAKVNAVRQSKQFSTSNASQLSRQLQLAEQERFTEYRSLLQKSMDGELDGKEIQRLNQVRLLLGKSLERVDADIVLLAAYHKGNEYQPTLVELRDKIASSKRELENTLEKLSHELSAIQAMDLTGQQKHKKIQDKYRPQVDRLRSRINALEGLFRCTFASARCDAQQLKKHLGL